MVIGAWEDVSTIMRESVWLAIIGSLSIWTGLSEVRVQHCITSRNDGRGSGLISQNMGPWERTRCMVRHAVV
jgi:hypothetical protein